MTIGVQVRHLEPYIPQIINPYLKPAIVPTDEEKYQQGVELALHILSHHIREFKAKFFE